MSRIARKKGEKEKRAINKKKKARTANSKTIIYFCFIKDFFIADF